MNKIAKAKDQNSKINNFNNSETIKYTEIHQKLYNISKFLKVSPLFHAIYNKNYVPYKQLFKTIIISEKVFGMTLEFILESLQKIVTVIYFPTDDYVNWKRYMQSDHVQYHYYSNFQTDTVRPRIIQNLKSLLRDGLQCLFVK